MGNYHEAYESYYNKILQKDSKNREMIHNGSYWPSQSYRATNNHRVNNKSFYNKGLFDFSSKNIANRIIFQLVGTGILIAIILFCKIYVTPETKNIYDYAKTTASTSFDYNGALAKIKAFDYKETYENINEYIEALKEKYLGEEKLMKTINENFMVPVKGDLIGRYEESKDLGWIGYDKGIVIKTEKDAVVLTPFSGVIRETGESEALGKYIVIDHGKGVETEYGNLDKISVKEGDKVEKGTTIAKVAGEGKLPYAHLYFELIYMGGPKDPEKYINFKGKSLT